MFFGLITFLWSIRETKAVLFWLYLWQIKEYRISRFLDHFRTEKGKRLLLNKLLILKILLILAFSLILLYLSFAPKFLFYRSLFAGYLIFSIIIFVFFLYLIESTHAIAVFLQKKLKKPVFTKKINFLIFTAIILGAFFLFILFKASSEASLFPFKLFILFPLGLLVFDVFTPIIVSIIIFIFQPLAVLWRNQIIKKAIKKRAKLKNLIVIGITGSYGKTSTKEFLAEILSERFNVLKTKEHQNTEIGVSQCILNDLKEEHQVFICEMGAYKRGEIGLLAKIAKPKIGILTGINEQHLALFGSQENIIKGKFELIESLPEEGLAVFNGDNEFIMSNLKAKMSEINVKSKIFYSLKERMDIWAENIKVEKEFISFRILSKDGDSADFKVNVLGSHNIMNILGAAAVAKELGMNLEEIAKASQKIQPKRSGMWLKKVNGLNIINATYSANPDGVALALDYLKVWGDVKKVVVMPCLIELGKASKEVHWRLGRKIAKICDLAIITTKDRFREIKEGAIKRGMSGKNILFIEDPKTIVQQIKKASKPGDVILLEGRIPKKIIEFLKTDEFPEN